MTDPFLDITKEVCKTLDDVGAVYAVTGSIASSVHGQPYSSLDVDVGVRLDAEQMRSFAQALPAHIYRDAEALFEALRTSSMSNLIDMRTQAKLDLCVFPRQPFYDSVLSRREKIAYRKDGPAFWTVSAEDIVLMKLLWRKDTQSRKQWENALSVIRIRGTKLDWSYMWDWAKRLDLTEDVARLRDKAGL